MLASLVESKMFINGEWVGSSSDKSIVVKNPANGKEIGIVPSAEREDVRKAIDAAEIAFGEWSEWSPHDRAQLLSKAAQAIREKKEFLARILTSEQGKPLREAIDEFESYDGFATCLDFYARLALSDLGSTVDHPVKERTGTIRKFPIGVCAGIIPWNYPVLEMGWKVAPALAAGNSVVIKPASTTPLTDLMIASVFAEIGLPRGVLNVVTGSGQIVGEELISNEKVRKISFTGETNTGKHVMELASKHVKRVTLELGGSDPMIVCSDADLPVAVKAAVWGRYNNCGQNCTAVKRLFLMNDISKEFVEKFVKLASKIIVGDGMNERTEMGPLNNKKQLESVENMISSSIEDGAKIAVGGSAPSGDVFKDGYFFLPTALTNVPFDSVMAKEECFGPALPIFIVNSFDEAIERANDCVYGLGASVWTNDITKAQNAQKRLEAGTIWINANCESACNLPFGGLKESGVGRELGEIGLHEYLETKSIVVDYSKSPKPWYFPFQS